MSDLISREDAIEGVRELFSMGDCYCDELSIVGMLNGLPSAEPEPEEFEWCDDCKEYDQEKHCCPRWNKVIRKTIEEMQLSGKIAKVIRPKTMLEKHQWDAICENCDGHLYTDYVFCPYCGVRLDWKGFGE